MPINLKSKSARLALKPGREPYWHCIRVGLYLGFRRTAEGEGTWVARQLQEGSKKYVLRSFGALDDYEQALKRADQWASGVDTGATHKAVTVEAACATYVKHLRSNSTKAAAVDAEGRFRRLIDGKPIGARPLDRLRLGDVKAWLLDQVDEDGDDDEVRRSKDSANRNLASLKAALNLALRDRQVATDAAWKTATKFPKVGKRRDRYLGPDERKALLEHCDQYIKPFVTALLLTGVRPGELANADVRHFDKQQGAITLTGKTGTRTVTLSTAARKFFEAQATDKLPAAPLIADGFGNRWNKDSWKIPFRQAVAAAGLPADVVTYTLRHVAISEMIAGGVDSFVVAKLTGTSTDMIDKHYGHLRHEQTRARLDAVQMV